MGKVRDVIARVKRLWQISAAYDKQMGTLRGELQLVHKRVGKHTTIHADLHLKEPSHIIAIGRYKNHDYVRIFDLDTHSFRGMVDSLRQLEPYGRPGRFDTLMGIPFEAFVGKADIFAEGQ